MVVEVALDDLSQPFPWTGIGWCLRCRNSCLMLAASPACGLAGFPLEEELAPTRLATDKSEAQEVEGLRLAEPAPLAVRRCMAAELDQTGLVRM